MVRKYFYLFLIELFFLTAVVFPQEINDTSSNENINKEQTKLSEIKDQITALENEIKLKSKKEKETFEVLENYNKQSFLLNKLINKLRKEERIKQRQINKSTDSIKTLKDEISILRKNYSKYIVAIYKYGKVNELASLFDAESVEQALLRYKYLNKFSEKREEDLSDLKTNIKKLNEVKEKLQREKLEKKLLADRKQKEENGLDSKLKERKKILSSIKNDKTELKKELDAKKTAEAKINQIIVKLIAEAEVKKNDLSVKGEELTNLTPDANPDNNYDINLSTSNFSSFSALKGKLNWPIKGGKIVRSFGKNVNNNLNTVTLNYGVDIKAASDVDVKAVADGVVSAVDWIPGYGSVIIVTHKGDYRTVYSHLAELFVSEGDKVKMGKVIAKIGESLEGNVLHFEIWNSRVNQNPEVWLAKK